MSVKMKKTESKRKPKSDAMAAVLEAAQDMADVGLINQKTMRGYVELCTVPELTAVDVARIRHSVHASQNYFARMLNVSPSTVQQWESGAKKPSGVAAKMLTVVEKHGLAVLA
jgi:putative transcriptional regulator